MKRLYMLTDGINVPTDFKYMDGTEYHTARENAKVSSGGEWWWVLVGPQDLVKEGICINYLKAR